MKAKEKLPENPSAEHQILIGPEFCGPNPPTLPNFLSKSDEKLGLIGDYNMMICSLDLLYDTAKAGNAAAAEELRLLSFRAIELADQFAKKEEYSHEG